MPLTNETMQSTLESDQNQYQDSRFRQWQLHSRRTLLSVDSNAFGFDKKIKFIAVFRAYRGNICCGREFFYFSHTKSTKIHISWAVSTGNSRHMSYCVRHFQFVCEAFFCAKCTFSTLKSRACLCECIRLRQRAVLRTLSSGFRFRRM